MNRVVEYQVGQAVAPTADEWVIGTQFGRQPNDACAGPSTPPYLADEPYRRKVARQLNKGKPAGLRPNCTPGPGGHGRCLGRQDEQPNTYGGLTLAERLGLLGDLVTRDLAVKARRKRLRRPTRRLTTKAGRR